MVEFKKLWWMVRKEWISLKRHPTRLVAIIVFPIIMILLFGYGMGGDLENLNVVVVAQDEGALTDATLDVIKDMEIYHVVDIIDDADEGREMVDNGDVKAAIILPSNYDEEDSNQKQDSFNNGNKSSFSTFINSYSLVVFLLNILLNL